MATPRAISIRKIVARERLAKACKNIAVSTGVPAPVLTERIKKGGADALLAQNLNEIAAFLEVTASVIEAASKPKPTRKSSKSKTLAEDKA